MGWVRRTGNGNDQMQVLRLRCASLRMTISIGLYSFMEIALTWQVWQSLEPLVKRAVEVIEPLEFERGPMIID